MGCCAVVPGHHVPAETCTSFVVAVVNVVIFVDVIVVVIVVVDSGVVVVISPAGQVIFIQAVVAVDFAVWIKTGE